MEKRVILKLNEGSFERGFQAFLRIEEDGALGEIEREGRLPPATELREALDTWQAVYRQIVTADFRIKPKPGQVTGVSYSELGLELVKCLNDWLNSGSEAWQELRDILQQKLDRNDAIRFIIQTRDHELQQLPWHLWSLFSQDYKNAEIALAPPEYEPPSPLPSSQTKKIKILAILGDCTNIDLEQDKLELQQLQQWNADLMFLSLPSRRDLLKQLRAQQWDILFFAGHSSSSNGGTTGQIQLNQNDSLSIHELRHSLRVAIGRGLQLAIFNSCDGLGLAHELADLHIPQIIVMRQPVQNQVAQEFLKYFLAAFVRCGKSFYLAVREARERLEEEQDDRFRCASWLPVICQNPATEPPTWQGLLNSKRDRLIEPIRKRLRTALLLSVIVTTAIVGVRQLGVLQPLELEAFDSLQRLRADEGPDPRLLAVTVTESDIQARKEWPLSDSTLAQLLAKLEQYQPRVIGLDIYRDLHVGSGQANLAPHLLNPRLIAVCETSAANKIGIPPPPKIPNERLGFSDVVVDPDGILRRHLLYMTTDSTSPCSANYAFSLQLAYRYLASKGIQPQAHPKQYLQIGNTVLKPLKAQTGGYQKLDPRGHQVLLNYRSAQNIAEQVTLSEALSGKLNSSLVQDRVVLIGVTASSVHDVFSTPYSAGAWPRQTMPGVLVQAQMVSQILSAVLDGRPLLSVWSTWGEIVWIWSWSIVGSAIAWVLRWRLLLRLGLVVVMLGTLSGLCFVLLQGGAWVPLVPSALALVVTGGSIVVAYTTSRRPPTSV